jgi:hypothetical protein
MDTLTNSFHCAEVRVRSKARTLELLSKYPAELSASERAHVRRVRNALCGVDACTCGVVREERL